MPGIYLGTFHIPQFNNSGKILFPGSSKLSLSFLKYLLSEYSFILQFLLSCLTSKYFSNLIDLPLTYNTIKFWSAVVSV